MNRSELKKVILGAIPKEILTLTIGYGINQTGACNRSGKLESFDNQFASLKDAKEYQKEIIDSGYSNTIKGIQKITIWSDIEAELEEIIFSTEYEIEEEEIKKIIKKIAGYHLQEIANKYL